MKITADCRIFFSLILVLLLLTGCQPTVYLMPTPVGLKSGDHDPFQRRGHVNKDNLVTVAYATNRIPANTDKKPYYSKKFDDTLRMGLATLRIGIEGEKWEELHAESTTGERSKDYKISLERVSPMGSLKETDSLDDLSDELRQFFTIINRALKDTSFKDITIYAHGANTGFYRSTAQGAQFEYFTGRNALVLVYSWPSAENILLYSKDVNHGRASAPMFARFVELLARHSQAENINILAYSAGSRLVDGALTNLGEKYADMPDAQARKALRLGQVYFAAPDVQEAIFLNSFPKYLYLTQNVTLTLNTEDSMLNFAHKYSGGSRLGKFSDDSEYEKSGNKDWFIKAINSPRFDVINVSASKIPDFEKKAHDYWYSNPWVSTDLLLQILSGAGPEERGLSNYETRLGEWIWYFPPDYDLRSNKAIEALKNKKLAQ
jgi:esterase/lipase superfamily enzyme